LSALLRTGKAIKRGEDWLHPITGDKLVVTVGDEDVFVMSACTPDTDKEVVCFVVGRTTLEQIAHGIEIALTVDPVKIRRA